MKIPSVMAFSLFLALATNAHADDEIFLSSDQTLGLIRSLYIAVDDQVTDNCWTNVSAIKSLARLKFEQNGIPVSKETLAFYTQFNPLLLISAVGFRTKNTSLCVCNVRIQLMTTLYSHISSPLDKNSKYFTVNTAINWDRSVVFISGSNFNDQIKNYIDENINELLADIISIRREKYVDMVLSAFPNSGKNPMTAKEFQNMLESKGK